MSAVLRDSSGSAVRADAPVPLLRTLVLCDLADSTALVERLGDRHAAEVFRRHDRLTRRLVQEHRGREIDKTDGFLVMFERPIEAVAFALDYQRNLSKFDIDGSPPLKARLGIHVGDVLTWGNSPEEIAKGAKPIEVEGLVKPIASRLMQLALPGQILLSGVAYQLAHRAQDALGEQAATALWRTHGRYRFKGIPDPIAVFEVGEEGIAPLKAPPWSGKAHREVPFWRRPATLGIELLALAALVAIPLWYLLRPEPAIAFAKRDWVVVGDLKNMTDDTSFDDSLETAFRIGLEQSRYVNVLSDLKTRATVKLMQRNPDHTVVDRAIGSEVAIRDGARALILPTVAEIGGRVRVTAEVIDPHTQTTVWSESADGNGESSVLPSLDKVSQKLRVRLGEALATVSNETQPLEKVTTGNLDALRAYSLGLERYGNGHYDEALALFEQAIKLDPDFALAYVGRASVLFSSDRDEDALGSIRKAQALRDHLPARDAMYVDAWEATFGPPTVSLQKWRTLAALFPDFFKANGAHAFFAWQRANLYDEAIEAAQRAATPQNPNRATSDYLLGVLYLGQERYHDADESFRRAIVPGATGRSEFRAMLSAAQRDFTTATSMLGSGASTGARSADLYPRISRVALAADQSHWNGALHEADDAVTSASAVASRKARQFEVLRLALMSVSSPHGALQAKLSRYLEGERTAFRTDTAVNAPDTAFHILLVAYLAAHDGDLDLAKTALDVEIPQIHQGYPLLAQMHVVAQAEQERIEGQAAQAIERLRQLLDGNELCIVHVALKDAYAANGDLRNARAQAAWLASHRGRAYVEYGAERVLMPFNVVQSDLAVLAEAEFARTLGDAAGAERRLADFRKIWPQADKVDFVAARLARMRATSADDKSLRR